ncbi:MAG: MFS transporter [Qipengyuania citrea]|jgi:MFS family permease|nr:MFS transporter [Qipengyuania citrea]MAG05532.1 MFS transporter [Sphingomonadaceae bacterium]MAQ28795.1 MFS transporter [Erythrobacter sp.]HBC16395.1 MFS transporter [Erythrobacter sp.]HBR84905.1 MFS transporter [Erythrobacter sp.]HCC26292.1 MFS transporter [Erythrobacter sp.]|tara:strand:- start:273 stop:1631 length:1359 start_codon:yes stop_codon:yes gene_type:complete
MADIDPARPLTEPPAERARAIPRGRMALLFAVMLTTAAGNTAMQSVMPSIGTSLGVDDVWISLAYSWSALLWVVCAPFWARKSDQRGRKAMMALGMLGFIASFVLCGLILWLGLAGIFPALWCLLLFAAARSLYGGFGSAAPPAVQAYVASRTPRAERTQALSLIASSFGLGTVIGPALAPLMVLPVVGLAGPFLVFALIGAITLVAVRWRLPNDEPQFPARGTAYESPHSGSPPNEVGKDESDEEDAVGAEPGKLRWFEPRLRPWVVSGLLGGHAQAMVLGIAGFLVLDRLGLRGDPAAGAGPVGLVLMAGAIATLLAQWGLIPRLDLGPRAASLWGIAIAAVGTVVLGLGQTIHTIALGYSIASLGFGLFRPGNTSGTSLAVSRAEQGQAGGVTASVAGASFIYAPALGVWLYNHSDWLGFGLIVSLCAIVFAYGWLALQPDAALTSERR